MPRSARTEQQQAVRSSPFLPLLTLRGMSAISLRRTFANAPMPSRARVRAKQNRSDPDTVSEVKKSRPNTDDPMQDTSRPASFYVISARHEPRGDPSVNYIGRERAYQRIRLLQFRAMQIRTPAQGFDLSIAEILECVTNVFSGVGSRLDERIFIILEKRVGTNNDRLYTRPKFT